jgi:hypothetical protein
MKHKLELQNIIEQILLRHSIDILSQSYYLRLSLPSYDDLVIEKKGDQILFGYFLPNPKGDLNPLVLFNYNKGYWLLKKIDLILGGIDKNQLMDWQKKYAENITKQLWLENGVRIE